MSKNAWVTGPDKTLKVRDSKCQNLHCFLHY